MNPPVVMLSELGLGICLASYNTKEHFLASNQHHWSSGRIRRCHRRGPCSIHG